jgi:hypothetical protein
MGLRAARDPESKGRGIVVEHKVRVAFERLCGRRWTLNDRLRQGVLFVSRIEYIDVEPLLKSQIE